MATTLTVPSSPSTTITRSKPRVRRCYHLAWALHYEAWRRHQLEKAAATA